jgi:predicted acylesterase/phospholipase RssA
VFALLLGLSPALAQETKEPARDDGVLLIVSFSGGGTRAAAFGFGVTRALAETPAGETSLLRRVDRVGGVSGGSLVAAQLAVDGRPAALMRFRKQVLLADIEAGLAKSAARNSLKLMRADYNRSHAAAAYYDTLFADARFGGVEGKRPELWIQATDMASARPLAFRPDAFGHLGLKSAEVSLGTAIAASAAVPGALPPLSLQVSGHTPARCPGESCGEGPGGRVLLADGGIVDNLGLEALFEGGVPEGTRAVVVVVVNSRRALSEPWKLDGSGLVSAGFTVALQQLRIDQLTLDRARERLRALEAEARADGKVLDTRLVVVGFEGSKRKQELDTIGTRFDLDAKEVELLIEEGRTLMRAEAAPLSELFGS